uniref:DDE Tnp4 domain-containing protein n=1 Tax=Brassica oleracea var. oleracea TaxID=109376 RepID=A0A0D3D864_BRAOL
MQEDTTHVHMAFCMAGVHASRHTTPYMSISMHWLHARRHLVLRHVKLHVLLPCMVTPRASEDTQLVGWLPPRPDPVRSSYLELLDQFCLILFTHDQLFDHLVLRNFPIDLYRPRFNHQVDVRPIFCLDHFYPEGRVITVGEEQSFQSSASMPSVNGEDKAMDRPIGVKAAKAKAKRPVGEEVKIPQGFKNMWEMRTKDLDFKDKLSNKKLLDSLIAKKEPLTELEVALKNKLITEMLSMGTSHTPPAMEARKPIVCGLSARGMIPPPLPQEDTDDDVADVTPSEVEVVEISDEEEADMVELSSDLIRVEESEDDLEPEFRRLLQRMHEEEKKLREEKFKAMKSGIKLEEGQSSKEYLRRPTPADLQHLLDIGEHRGFPGMIGSIDCTLKDINVLDPSPVFDDIIKGPKAVLFAQHQEAVRKEVERAFGVLQAHFAIVKNPAFFWDKGKIGKIIRACIIFHNMIVEDERDGYTQYDVSEFQQGEDTGSSHVDLTFSTDIPTNIGNMMGVRTRIRDKHMHEQLKADLVEHVWCKFGRGQDNN